MVLTPLESTFSVLVYLLSTFHLFKARVVFINIVLSETRIQISVE